jgi:hypothetical protein
MGVSGMLGFLSILGFALVIPGLVWLYAYLKTRPPGQFRRKFAMAVVPFFWLLAFAALFAHQDPRCEEVHSDGSVVSFDPTGSGMSTGWIWDIDTSTYSGSQGFSGDIVSGGCTSDVVVLWETIVGLALLGCAIGLGWTVAAELGSSAGGPTPASEETVLG